MVLTDAKGVDTDLIGQDRLVNHVAEHLRLRQQTAGLVDGDVTERIESEID